VSWISRCNAYAQITAEFCKKLDKQREFYSGPKSLADFLNDQKHFIKPVLDLKLWRFPRARRPQNTSYLPQTTDSSDWI
jgi:hypothetical protein